MKPFQFLPKDLKFGEDIMKGSRETQQPSIVTSMEKSLSDGMI